MYPVLIVIILVIAGLTCIGGAWFQWPWFMTADNARPFVEFVGRTRARLAYGLLGLAFLGCGILFVAGVLRLPEAGAVEVRNIPNEIRLPSGEIRRIIKAVPPDYPHSLRDQGISGDIVVRIWVAQDGTVSGTQIRSSPNDELSAAATNAVRQWVFEASSDPKPLTIEIPLHFEAN